MQSTSAARIVADTPGRLRIALPLLRRDPGSTASIEAHIGAHPAVTEVVASPLTGWVLVSFSASMHSAALLAELGTEPAAAATGGDTVRGPCMRAAAPPPQAVQPYPPCHLRGIGEALSFDAGSIGLGLPVILLGVSAALPLLSGALAEACAIGAVLVMNAAIRFETERRAEASITALSELVDDTVPGDVMPLAPGRRIVADMRLLEARGLKVDESTLTGESFPGGKDTAALPGQVPLAERHNMVYRGTAVASGTGLGLVVGTGSRTEAGAVELLNSLTVRPRKPLQVQLDQLGNQLVRTSALLCMGGAGVGLLRGQQGASLLRSALALGIAAVPEGLPAVATTSLARGLRRMRAHGVLLRHCLRSRRSA